MVYQLELPRRIVFGPGAVAELAGWLGKTARVLLVCGPSAVRTGLVRRVMAAAPGCSFTVCDAVRPEPNLGTVAAVRDAIVAAGAGAVVALGGGSVMDVGKVAAAIAHETYPVEDYFFKRRAVPPGGLPFAALPTTAGTGAEATPNAVFVDEASSIKQSIRSVYLLPDLALVDPELTLDCPARVTAESGMDALTQGIESYVARHASNATRPLALEGVKLIFGALLTAVRNGGDCAARSAMAEGTLLGAMAFGASGLGAVHGLAHPVGAKYHLGHGLVCGVLLPTVMRWNLPVAEARYAELAAAAGLSDAPALIAAVDALRQAAGLPPKLGPLGLREADFDWIVANSRSGSMKSNPRDLSDDDLRLILKQLL